MKFSKTLILALPLTSIALSGCNQTKQVFGMNKNPPNEFAVMERAPLEVPPEFNLRPPQPGVKRPQEVARKLPHQKAKETVLKDRKIAHKSKNSSLERRLLANAGANKADPQIRSKIDSEAYIAANKHKDKNWLGKKLPFYKAPKDRNLIDPRKEAERLKREGTGRRT